ncbi:rhomboid family intramembrane serine protease [Neorhizobium alkalisoli]|uniref:Membrane associated rhomboid family serine protease n=1 Tax=Neorhizobium alkalisoli TaxID=528178 RepID=A0A561QJ30_9HYPH|nr:rhomboid family intramembrane serine protease [Neorhizobium alkalisoli]TWF50355.1 membrane associated rhomboid family serine protease [Neorhizobium alkalisoli]
MFIPLHDAVELKHIRAQYVTIGLIAANVLAWAFTTLAEPETAEIASLGLGFIPAVIFHYAVLDPSLIVVPTDATFITYAFLHVDFWHLASNMIFLWVFGDNVEDALGHMRFLIFYLLCAAAGALVHGLIGPSAEGPLLGASGAVSGVVAAYFLLHPRVRVWVLVLFRIPLPLPAFIPLTLWIIQQFVMLWLDFGGMVSWGAHVGGILTGALLVLVMRRPGVPLFDREIVTPKAVRHKTATPQAAPLRE